MILLTVLSRQLIITYFCDLYCRESRRCRFGRATMQRGGAHTGEVNILINILSNLGYDAAYNAYRSLTKEGIELTMASHLIFGTYLLAELAYPTLKNTPNSVLPKS